MMPKINVHLQGHNTPSWLSDAKEENVIWDNSTPVDIRNFEKTQDTLDFRPVLGASEHLGQNVFINHHPVSQFHIADNGHAIYLEGADKAPSGRIEESKYKVWEVTDIDPSAGVHQVVKLLGFLTVDHATLAGVTDSILAH